MVMKVPLILLANSIKLACAAMPEFVFICFYYFSKKQARCVSILWLEHIAWDRGATLSSLLTPGLRLHNHDHDSLMMIPRVLTLAMIAHGTGLLDCRCHSSSSLRGPRRRGRRANARATWVPMNGVRNPSSMASYLIL